MASRSAPSCALVRLIPAPLDDVVMEKWNADGMRTAMTAISRRDEFS